jgi:site-specific DNA-methyltransferase (adenine-specific)
MIQASTHPGDWCLDFFAGSGTLGAVAAKLDRRYVLIDCNPEAIRVIRKRLGVPVHDDAFSQDGLPEAETQSLDDQPVVAQLF